MGKKEYNFKPFTSCDLCTWRTDNGRWKYLSVNTLLACIEKVISKIGQSGVRPDPCSYPRTEVKPANTVNQQWTSSEKVQKHSILGISAFDHWKSSCGNFSIGNKVLSVIFHTIKQWEVLIFHQMITHPIQEKLSVFHLISIQNNTMMPYRNDSLNGHYSNPFLFSGLGSASEWHVQPSLKTRSSSNCSNSSNCLNTTTVVLLIVQG